MFVCVRKLSLIMWSFVGVIIYIFSFVNLCLTINIPTPYTQIASKIPEIETLDEAFKNFEEVCQKYTATGKGIMGSQQSQQGNMKSAVALWEESGKIGNAKSRFNLAVCYETGSGVKSDIGQVFHISIYLHTFHIPYTCTNWSHCLAVL